MPTHSRRVAPTALPFSLLALLTITAAGEALASDGVIELNQTCATQTGCFPGDGAGYPITIYDASGPRSFRLTSDLVLASASETAIFVNVADASIDLAGFQITREDCLGSTTSCLVQGSSGGGIVHLGGFGNDGLSVANGSIVGMGGYGIRAFDQADVRNVRARWNSLAGIYTGDGSTVEGCEVRENGARGIEAGTGSTVQGNTAHGNQGDGIYVAYGGVAERNSAYFNQGDGIETGAQMTIRGISAAANGDDGIKAGQASTVVENTTGSNGSDGIEATSGLHRIHGNTATFNGSYGLRLTSSDGYSDNRLGSNGTGGVNAGVNLGGNYCSGVGVAGASCP